MQRTLTIVLVPALLFLALAIMALEPGGGQSAKAPEPAKAPPAETSTAGTKSKDDTGKMTQDATPSKEVDDTGKTAQESARSKKVDDTESLARMFGRLMRKERALKGADERPAAETNNPIKPAVPDRQEVATSREPRSNKLTVLPPVVALVPRDLAELDPQRPVEQLTITGDQFTNRSLRELAGMRIISLSVEAVHISNAGLVHLTKLAALRELRLWTPGVSDEGLSHLAKLPDLELLDLEGTHVRGAGLVHLSDLGKLRHLTLGSLTQDSDLLPLKSLTGLEVLDLRSCRQLTDASVGIIAELNQLDSVWLPPHVGVADKLAVRQSLPHCLVRW